MLGFWCLLFVFGGLVCLLGFGFRIRGFGFGQFYVYCLILLVDDWVLRFCLIFCLMLLWCCFVFASGSWFGYFSFVGGFGNFAFCLCWGGGIIQWVLVLHWIFGTFIGGFILVWCLCLLFVFAWLLTGFGLGYIDCVLSVLLVVGIQLILLDLAL